MTWKKVPWKPDKILKAMKHSKFGDKAAAIVNSVSTTMHALYAIGRPHNCAVVSRFSQCMYELHTVVIGPQIKLESPMVNNTPALDALMTSAVVPNSPAISLAAEKSEVELKQAAKVAKLVVKTTMHF